MDHLKEKLLNSFGSYKDFPKPGIIFCDILPVLRDKELFRELIYNMSEASSLKNSDAIVAIDARGFIFGTAISFYLSKPMVVARKPGKLPGKLLKKSYELEYGSNSLTMQIDSIEPYNSFAIVDDLLATGGTAKCVSEIIEEAGKNITGLSVVVELKALLGKNKLNCYVDSQIII